MDNERPVKYIVITSVFEPTKAVEKFAGLSKYQLVVVGDLKTPTNWNFPNVQFLDVKSEQTSQFFLNSKLPFNHYCRKMLGYLYAIKNGAEVIIDTDDDNIPKTNWDFPEWSGKFNFIENDLGFINVYNYFTEQNIWPRGLPLDDILKRNTFHSLSQRSAEVGVWQIGRAHV